MSSQPTTNATAVESGIELIAKSPAPLTLTEVAKRVSPALKSLSAYKSQLASALSNLPTGSGVFEWPTYSRMRVFAGRSVQAAVEDAFTGALDEQPLTVAKGAPIVSKALRRISEKRVLKEIKPIATALVSERRIFSFAANRQSVVYFSFLWLENLLPGRKTSSSAGDVILKTIRELEPGSGNYVRVDHLRSARAVRHLVDDAVIELADAGELVLARYDGSHQMPDHEKIQYIEDKQGELFIGVALPRAEDSSL